MIEIELTIDEIEDLIEVYEQKISLCQKFMNVAPEHNTRVISIYTERINQLLKYLKL